MVVFNLLFFVAGLLGLLRSTGSVLGSIFITLVGLVNAIICGIVALAALRRQALSVQMNAGPKAEEGEEGWEDASDDSPPAGDAPE